jgi:hypothetical protein
MPLQDLLEWVNAKPFAPFRMHLTDGRVVDVTNPHQIWPGRQSALIGYLSAEDPQVYERHVTVGLLHIVSIEPLATPAQA